MVGVAPQRPPYLLLQKNSPRTEKYSLALTKDLGAMIRFILTVSLKMVNRKRFEISAEDASGLLEKDDFGHSEEAEGDFEGYEIVDHCPEVAVDRFQEDR